MISHAIESVTITIGGTELNTTSAAAAAAGATSAVNTVTISSGRDTPLAHQSAGTISLTVVHTDPLAIALSKPVRISIDLDGETIGIAYGWVTAWTVTRTSSGLYAYRISCTDVIGRAAGLMYGSTPRPVETIAARLTAIDQAHGTEPIIALPDPAIAGQSNPLDVDNRSVLDVAQTTAPVGYIVTTAQDPSRLTIQRTPGGTIVYPRISDGPTAAWQITGNPSLLALHASQVENIPRTLDRTSTISEVHYTYRTHTGEQVDTTYKSTGRTDGSTIDITSDSYSEIDVYAWAQRIFATTSSGVPMFSGPVHLVNLTPAQIKKIIGPAARGPLIITIAGAPPDVMPEQMITGLELAIARQRITIAARLMPVESIGITGLRWIDIPESGGQTWQSYQWPAAANIRYQDTYYLTNGGT